MDGFEDLNLTLGRPIAPDPSPNLSDFLGPPRRDLDLPDVRVWPQPLGAAPREPRQWSVLFVPEGLLPIPEVEATATEPRDRTTKPAWGVVRSTAAILWIPLGLFATPALAHGPGAQPTVPATTQSSPTNDDPRVAKPTPSTSPQAQEKSSPESDTQPVDSQAEASSTEASSTSNDDATTQPAEPAEVVKTTPVPSSSSDVDAAWQGVVGQEVRLKLTDGTSVQGRIGAVQDDTFTFLDTGAGGVVRVLPKSSVASLLVGFEPVEIPKHSGIGILIGGAVATTAGIPLAVSGVVMLAIVPSAAYLHLPLLLSGGVGLAIGIPMLVVGSRRQRAFKAALAGHKVAVLPHVGAGRRGAWTGGLTFAF